MFDQPVIELLDRNFNVRAIACCSTLLLNVLGCLFVYTGIKDDGFIDIKTAFIEGHVKSGLVGLIIIFLGVMLSVILVLNTYSVKRSVEVDFPNGIRIKVQGSTNVERTLLSVAKTFPIELKAAGVEFTNGDEQGVKLRRAPR